MNQRVKMRVIESSVYTLDEESGRLLKDQFPTYEVKIDAKITDVSLALALGYLKSNIESIRIS